MNNILETKWIGGGIGISVVLALAAIVWSRLDTRAMARKDAKVQADTDAVIAAHVERSKVLSDAV